jgi:hypothetical protein
MRRPRLLSLLAIAALAACSDGGPVSGPGTLTATLISPNGPEGAALVILVGDGVGDVTPVGNTEVFARAGSSTTRIVLLHQAGGELSFRVAVADTTQPPEAVVQEVAGSDDELRATLADYSLEFRR